MIIKRQFITAHPSSLDNKLDVAEEKHRQNMTSFIVWNHFAFLVMEHFKFIAGEMIWC